MKYSPIEIISLYLRALTSARKASGLSDVAVSFNRFGRQLGWKLIWQMERGGFSYLVNPVSSLRYFEFPFALSSLPEKTGRCLDVSSPRLFSYYVAKKCFPSSIWMINPDQEDIHLSKRIAKRQGYQNIATDCVGVDILDASKGVFDTVWSISVIEHISGKYDDRWAVKLMYDSLSVGGCLILTIPVDRRFWEEYRDQAYYNIQQEQPSPGNYFFQRYYDKMSIWSRLVDAIGVEPSSIRWFGEKQAGHFFEYEKQWIREGYKCIVNDPLDISVNYQEYSSWEVMPGMGVCGLVFKKESE